MVIQPTLAKLKALGVPAGFLAGILLLWEGSVTMFKIKNYLLPPPSSILGTMIREWSLLWENLVVTMLEALVGFLVAIISALAVAVAFSHFPLLARGLYPYAIALKTTPVIAMAPLLVVGFGTGFISKVIVVALVCFFPILVNALKGLTSVESEAIDLFRTFRASTLTILFYLRIPMALPYIFSALKVASSLAVVGAVIGEFHGAQKGIGLLILSSSYRIETSRMYAGIVLLALAGSALFATIAFMEKRFVFWSPEIVKTGVQP